MAQHTQSPKPGDLLAAAATTPLSSHQNEEVPWLCPCGHTNDATAKRCSGPGNSLTGRCMAWKGGQRNPKPYFTKIKVGRHPITSSSRGLYINTYILCCRRIFCQRYSTRRRTNQKPRLQRLSSNSCLTPRTYLARGVFSRAQRQASARDPIPTLRGNTTRRTSSTRRVRLATTTRLISYQQRDRTFMRIPLEKMRTTAGRCKSIDFQAGSLST